MAKFYPLKVNDVRRETHDSVSVAFEVPQPCGPNTNISKANI